MREIKLITKNISYLNNQRYNVRIVSALRNIDANSEEILKDIEIAEKMFLKSLKKTREKLSEEEEKQYSSIADLSLTKSLVNQNKLGAWNDYHFETSLFLMTSTIKAIFIDGEEKDIGSFVEELDIKEYEYVKSECEAKLNNRSVADSKN